MTWLYVSPPSGTSARIRTTSKNPVTRLFVALAFILVNLWVYLLWFFVSRTQPGGRVVYRELFSLRTMLEFLSQAVERHFPVITAIYCPFCNEFAIY
jgi:putative transposase